MYATYRGCTPIVQALIAHSADVNVADKVSVQEVFSACVTNIF